MPKLVKGGKNAFGWSKVNENGKIVIPPDAYSEYNFSAAKYVYLLSGSKKSGGFGLTTLNLLKESYLSEILHTHPELEDPESIIGNPMQHKSKTYCCVPIFSNTFTVPLDVLEIYGVKKDSLLLTVRGSYVALGFIVKGPIIEEAKRHPELKVYQ